MSKKPQNKTAPSEKPVTVDELLSEVPAGWNVMVRTDEGNGWWAQCCQNGKSGNQAFSFNGPTAVIALSRAVGMAVSYQLARDAEMLEQYVPYVVISVPASKIGQIAKILEEPKP